MLGDPASMASIFLQLKPPTRVNSVSEAPEATASAASKTSVVMILMT